MAIVEYDRHTRENPASHIDQVQYVGGYQTKDKGYFIFVTRHFESGKEPVEVMWVFVTDGDGLVDLIL